MATASAGGFLWAYNAFNQLMIDVGSQQSPQLIYFGTDTRVKDPSTWVVPIELLAAYFFVLIALMFVGPGQEMGRRFAAIDNRLLAYTADILGQPDGHRGLWPDVLFPRPGTLLVSDRAGDRGWFRPALALASCAGRAGCSRAGRGGGLAPRLTRRAG